MWLSLAVVLCLPPTAYVPGPTASGPGFHCPSVGTHSTHSTLCEAATARADMSNPYDFAPVTDAQRQAMEDNSRVLLFCGSWGSAKTEAGLRKVVALCDQFPGISVRLLRYFARDAKAMLFPRLMAMLPPQWVKEVNRQDATLTIVPGHGKPSHVRFGGLKLAEGETNPWAGTEYGFTLIDEATEIKDAGDFDAMVMRSARQPHVGFNQVMLLCNAGAPGHWLYTRFYSDAVKWQALGYRLIEGSTIPRSAGILPAAYYTQLDALTGVLRARYVENQWVAHEGLVYPYDPRRQVLTLADGWYVNSQSERICQPEQLATWRCVQSADIGIDHPTVYQWWRVSPDDLWVLQREVHMAGRAMSRHARDILVECKRLNVQPDCYHDPSAELAVEEWRRAGIACRPAVNDRLAGQQAVFDLFPHPVDAAGENLAPCRIYFCADALIEVDIARQMRGLPIRTVDEFGTYLWRSGAKDDMGKDKDDGMDAMRYGVASERIDVQTPCVVTADLSSIVGRDNNDPDLTPATGGWLG